MQSDLFEEHKPALPDDEKAELHRQLVKLGDMLGDGMGDERGGAWIKKDYRRVMKALGYDQPQKPRPTATRRSTKGWRGASQRCNALIVGARSGRPDPAR